MKLWCYFAFVGCFCVVVINSNPPSCTTPNGENAHCISLFSCPVLQQAVSSTDPLVKKFVEASACGDGQFMVCCGTSGNYTQHPDLGNRYKENTTEESHRDYVIRKVLPNKTYCGLQHTDDYVYTGNATSVDEFPWMAYVPLGRYDKFTSPGFETKCAAVLLSNEYALTTIQCGSERYPLFKFGQYHRHKNISCIQTSFGVDDCTEPTIEVEPARRITVPQSDLMLVKLATSIRFSDFVRPICLPLEESDRPQKNDTIVTSGWGEAYYGGSTLKIKKRVKHMVARDEECKKDHDSSKAPSLCVTTLPNSTSYACDGDDGGPMMYKHKNNWFVGGIITSIQNCAENKPVRGERITAETIEWIIDFMRP